MVNEIISHKKKKKRVGVSEPACARALDAVANDIEWWRRRTQSAAKPSHIQLLLCCFFLYSFSSPCGLTPSGRKKERKKSQPKCPPRRNQTRGRALEIRDGYGPFKKTTNGAIRHPIRPRSTYTIMSSLCMTTHRDIKKKNSFSVIRHTE
jgi:hypothetical protein